MRKLKILLFTFLTIFIINGCGNTNKFHDTDLQYSQGKIISLYEMQVTNYQLDSICKADTLSNNLHDWIKSSYNDFETGKTIYKYTFIKRYDNNGEVIYILNEYKTDSLVINKRIKTIK